MPRAVSPFPVTTKDHFRYRDHPNWSSWWTKVFLPLLLFCHLLFNQCSIVIFCWILFLWEGQAGAAWEPPTIGKFCRISENIGQRKAHSYFVIFCSKKGEGKSSELGLLKVTSLQPVKERVSVATFAAIPDSVLAGGIRRFVLFLWWSLFRNDFGQRSSCFREHTVMVLSYGCWV